MRMEEILNKVENRLREINLVKEKTLALSREIILSCRKGIQDIHNGDLDDARKRLRVASRKVRNLYRLLEGFPELKNAGYIENAVQEYVEAKCLYSIERRKTIPDPDKIGVSYITYLLGLCDTIGELRRFSLDAMKEGEIDRANDYLGFMERIYNHIAEMDYPPALKRKRDIARSLIEKTKSELAVASCEKRIQDKIEEFRGFLDAVEKGKLREKGKLKKEMDLDVDGFW